MAGVGVVLGVGPGGRLAGQCLAPVQTVPNGTISSGSALYSTSNALEATGVTINGSASVQFVAGNCIHLGAGFRATAGTAGTTFHAWVETAPAMISVAPQSGEMGQGTLTWTVGSPSGVDKLAEVQGLVNGTLTGVNGCYVRYARDPDLIYLADNAGTGWLGGFAPGSGGTAANSQCSISGAGASVSVTGNQMALSVPVVFHSAFGGLKNNYLKAFTKAGYYSGWQAMGTLQVAHYQLTTGVNPAGGGTITPGSGVYGSGAQVAVSAAAAPGYVFTGFSGALTGTVTPQTVTMDGNRSVTANFSASGTQQHVISSSPAGLTLSVDGVNCTTPCNYSWVPGSNHTVVAAFRQQLSGTTHYFSYLGGLNSRQAEQVWSGAGVFTNPITAQSSPTTYTAYYHTDPLVTLRTCLSSSASSNCTLAQGVHPVTSTIRVEREKVVIRGESSDRMTSRLRRDASLEAEMMVVAVAGPAQGITIRDLTFCGGSIRSTPGNGCPVPQVETTCGAWQSQIHQNLRNGLPPPADTWICTDLAIARADTGRRPADPWTDTGPYSVTITNAAFEGATGHAISIYPEAPQEVNDVYITGTAINSSEVTGLLVGMNSENYDDHRLCASEGFKDDELVHVPRNIRVEGNTGDSNGFRNNLTGAMGINAARWFALRDNKFLNNYYSPQGGNVCGGTFLFAQCTDKVQIETNTLIGPTNAYYCTGGMELWGKNIDVDSGNSVAGYVGEGIGLNSVFHATVQNNTTANNGGDGIWVATRETGACSPAYRETDDVTISGNSTTAQGFGVVLAERESTNIMNAMTISSSGTVRRQCCAN